MYPAHKPHPHWGQRKRNSLFLILAVSSIVTFLAVSPAALAGSHHSRQPSSHRFKKASERSHQASRTNVSRAAAKLRDDPSSPHARKGKKGFTVGAKRTEPPPETIAVRRRSVTTSASAAKKPQVMRSANVVRPSVAPDDSSPREQPPTTPVLAANDRIEVIEWDKRQVSKVPAPAGPGGSTPGTGASGRPIVSTKRIEVEIEPARVTQIQQALTARGFLSGEPSGVYDEGTIEAMRQFQISQKIDVTGYPTAQALKRLGL